MKILFHITFFPDKGYMHNRSIHSNISSYLEGHLKILVNDILFFDQPHVLLLELSNSIESWLSKIETAKLEDFIYHTIDHNSPIIQLKHVGDDKFVISSVWAENAVSSILILRDIKEEFNKYIDNINDAVKLHYSEL